MSNKHLPKGGKWYFLLGIQTLLSTANDEKPGTLSVWSKCGANFVIYLGLLRSTANKLLSLKCVLKHYTKENNSLLLSRNPFFQCSGFCFSNFHVTKVKEFISFITKINKNSIEQARSGRIGKYAMPTSF